MCCAPLCRAQYLDSEDSTKPIYLYVNCPGGSVIAGLALFDTMQHIRSEVVTINVGLAASMASFILAAGAKVCVRTRCLFAQCSLAGRIFSCTEGAGERRPHRAAYAWRGGCGSFYTPNGRRRAT